MSAPSLSPEDLHARFAALRAAQRPEAAPGRGRPNRSGRSWPNWRSAATRVGPYSPRVRSAMQLYESGLVPTKGRAAQAVGLAPATLYAATARSVMGEKQDAVLSPIRRAVQEHIVETITQKLKRVSEEAVDTLSDLMHYSEKEGIRLRAAIDLADRGPETAKIQKHQVESISLTGKDVERLRAGIVEAARIRSRVEVPIDEHGNLIRVPVDTLPDESRLSEAPPIELGPPPPDSLSPLSLDVPDAPSSQDPRASA